MPEERDAAWFRRAIGIEDVGAGGLGGGAGRPIEAAPLPGSIPGASHNPGSFSGRTAGSDPADRGSSPRPGPNPSSEQLEALYWGLPLRNGE